MPENSSPGAPNACHREEFGRNGNERDACAGAVGLLGGGNSVVQVSTSL